ncbi:MAG: M81 family metallopeptidase [Gammaproteobacteria bacterium]|nr:M81 family metallopeptidase [Gammaproteobacteria bacterium]
MSKPRIAIAGMQHETNTFAPLLTTYQDFTIPGAWPGLTEGDALFAACAGINIPIAGFIEAATDWELVPLLWTAAEPAGYVTTDAFDRICSKITDGLQQAGTLDGVYLDLHGAMVTELHSDGEAEILRRVRAVVGDSLPVVVSLDLHGNLSPEFFERATAVAVYRTYPHLDMAETGARAKELLQHALVQPLARAWRQVDFIIPLVAQSTMREPARRLYAKLPELSRESVLSVDIALGFPPADIPHNGPSIFAYGLDQASVDAAADRMLDLIQNAEQAFSNPLIPAREAVQQAMELSLGASRPVVIADPQDNPGAGGMGDSTGLLQALLDAGAKGAALSMLWDPESAAAAHEAGEGAEISVSLGGQYPDIGGPAIETLALVEKLSDGVFAFSGPMYGGATAQLGPSACLHLVHDQADVRVIVGSRRCQNADQAMFSAFGVDPRRQNILVIKSAVHFLNDYDELAEEVVFADAPGANECKLDVLPFTRLRPGIKVGPGGRLTGA